MTNLLNLSDFILLTWISSNKFKQLPLAISIFIVKIFNFIRIGLMLPCGIILKTRGTILYLIFTTLVLALKLCLDSTPMSNVEKQHIYNLEFLDWSFSFNLISIIYILFLILSVFYITYCIIAISRRLQDLTIFIFGPNKLFEILNLDLISYFKKRLEKKPNFNQKIRYALLRLKCLYFIYNLYLTYIIFKLLIFAINVSNQILNQMMLLETLSFELIAAILFFIIFAIILYKPMNPILVKLFGQDKLYSHKLAIVKAFLSSDQKSLETTNKILSLSILNLILKVIVLFFILIGYCHVIIFISHEISRYGLALGLLNPMNELEVTPLYILPEENRSLITTNRYKLRISQNGELNLNPIGTSSSHIEKFTPANPRNNQMLEKFLAENIEKEKKLAIELEKSLKVLVKSNQGLDGKDFMVKNKNYLKTVYELNFKIMTKGYLIPELLRSYPLSEGFWLSSYKPILEVLNVNMDKHPLLNANWELSTNLLGSPADIIRIPEHLHNSYVPYVFSYDEGRLKGFHRLIMDQNLVNLTEKSFWRTETLPLKLSWSESSLIFNYNINLNLDNVQYAHKLAISHLFPSLKIVSSLKKDDFTSLYEGPLSKYFDPAHFMLTDNEGSVSLARIILPPEFNTTLPNSLCYIRENLVPKFGLNLCEADWLFDQDTSVLEYFRPEGYIINIKLDKDLLSVLGFRKYLRDAFFPAITKIEAPFSIIVGSNKPLSLGPFPKVQLLGEEGLQLFSKELLSIRLEAGKLSWTSLINQLKQGIAEGVPTSICVACLNAYLNDSPLNTLFNIDYERLNLQDFLIKKSLIVFDDSLYIFLPKVLNSTGFKYILIPLDYSQYNSEAAAGESKVYLKKMINKYINNNNISKIESEFLKKIIKNKLS